MKKLDGTTVVIVSTPSGRRQKVEVQPNTPIIKILEKVCEEYELDANKYDLRYNERVLDLTTTHRLSGLPQNAHLKIVEAKTIRIEKDVELVLQLTDGNRLNGKFKPNTKLYDIIQQLCPDECNRSDLVVIYIQTEISKDKLAETSLKDLGLLGGRAILRLGQDSNATKNATKIEENKATTNLNPEPIEPNKSKDEDEDISEIHLGDRSAVLFKQDADREANSVDSSELSDSYFELNANDLKLLLGDLKISGDGQQLTTSEMRGIKKEERKNRYNSTTIRIQFPNRYVLQGVFTPNETIETIIEFVQQYLQNPQIDFYLFETPPKKIMSNELSLFDAKCVPSGTLHFGCRETQANYLKDDILKQVSSARALRKQAAKDRQQQTASKAKSLKKGSTADAKTSKMV